MLQSDGVTLMSTDRRVRQMDLLWVAVSAMIGSGWLFGPFYAAKIAGPAAILSWLIGGVLVLFSAFTLAELSAMLPLPGGITRFTQLSHGTAVGFTMSWMAWLSLTMIPVIEVQALVQYSANYLPFLTFQSEGHTVLSFTGTLIAASLLILISLFNALRVDQVTRTSSKISYIKILIPLSTVLVLLLFRGHYDNLSSAGFFEAGWSGVLAALPGAGIAFSYFGFHLAISLAKEVENPQKTMPFALMGSLLICTLLYMSIQLAFIVAIPPDLLEHGWSGLEFTGEAGPFVGLTLMLGLVPLSIILYIDAFVSPLGSAMITMTSNSRIQMGMSLIGYFPEHYQKLNAKGAPARAIVLNLLLGLTLLLPFPGWQQMAEFIIAALVFSHAFAPLSLVTLRRQLPDQERPFKLPFHYFISYLAFAILNLMTYWCGWSTLWKMYLTLGAGYLFLWARRAFNAHVSLPPLDLKHAHWLWPYLLLVAVISYGGHFGGGLKIIPQPWDWISVILMSAVIFVWASISGKPGRIVQAEVDQALSV